MITPDTTPTTGPVSAIISRGESGIGMEFIIAASFGCLERYGAKNRMCAAVTQKLLTMPIATPLRNNRRWPLRATTKAHNRKMTSQAKGSTEDGMKKTVPTAMARPNRDS